VTKYNKPPPKQVLGGGNVNKSYLIVRGKKSFPDISTLQVAEGRDKPTSKPPIKNTVISTDQELQVERAN